MTQHDLLDQFPENEKKIKRPVAITLVCVLGFAGAALTFATIFTHSFENISASAFYLWCLSIVGLFCMIGLWYMKKWAAYVYIGMAIINQILLATIGRWNLTVFVVLIIIIGIIIFYLKKMH